MLRPSWYVQSKVRNLTPSVKEHLSSYEKLKLLKTVYTFAVATHGGIPSKTLTQTEKLFSKYEMQLSSGFAVLMIDNATMNADTISIEKQNKRLAKAENKIANMCELIKKGKKTIHRSRSPFNWLLNSLYRKVITDLPGFDKNFSLDENCNGCGTCVKICPVINIIINDKKPVWQHHCEQCLACFHWCPAKAIQYGSKTAKRSRYHHPKVTLKDMVLRNE